MNPDQQLRQQFEVLLRRLAETRQLDVVADMAALEPTIHAFFDTHINDADPGKAGDFFFGHVNLIWLGLLPLKQYDAAELLWQEAVACARRWEAAHQPHLVHKGSAYYWWGGTAFLRQNVRRGFLLVHAALEEDRQKHYRHDEDPDTPALTFVTLDARNEDQYFRDLVQVGTDELEQRLSVYRIATGSALQFGDLQARYAKKHAIRESVFIFTMSVVEAVNLQTDFSRIGAGDKFGAQLAANCLFDLCQVVEEAIREKHPQGRTFNPLAKHLSGQFGWPDTPDPFGDINGQQQNNFDATVRGLVANTIIAGGRPPVTSLERDLWLTYVVRNSTAHGLSSKLVLQEQFVAMDKSCKSRTMEVWHDNAFR